MGYSLLLCNTSLGATAGQTWFFPAAHGIALGTTAAQGNITWQTAGTFSQLYIRIIANAATGASTCTLRKGGVGQTNSISIPNAATGEFFFTSGADAVVAGNVMVIAFTNGAGGGLTVASVGIRFDANTSGAVDQFCLRSDTGAAGTSATTFGPLTGYANNFSATEGPVQVQMTPAGTLRNLYCEVDSNTRTTSTTVGSRIAGVNGNLSISIPTTSTGVFQDTSNSDVVVANQLLNYSFTFGSDAAHSIVIKNTSAEYFNGVDSFSFVSCVVGGSVPSNATYFYALSGNFGGGVATESSAAWTVKSALNLANLKCNIAANTEAGSVTVRFRKNTANGNQVISIPSGATGYFEDTSNTDVIAIGDAIDISVTSTLHITFSSMAIVNTGSYSDLQMFDLTPGSCVVWSDN